MDNLLQNTGLLVLAVNLVTQILKWVYPDARPTALTKIACFTIVGLYTLGKYVVSQEVLDYALSQLVVVYLLSTKLYDVFTNRNTNA